MTVLQAMQKNGLAMPHYCYHDALSIAGNCRICMVEVEKARGLQTSCTFIATEGLVVHTDSPKVKEAQKNVMEFLLVNHPIDCPICDCSGECRLQDYYMDYSGQPSRLTVPKIRKPKVQDIGPHVMLDAERCIQCTRCVRFCSEVTKTGELGIFNRGTWSEISLCEGKKLDNGYSGNVVDICPVGALTDKQFRFRSRVWYLQETASICPGCSRGCNIYLHTNENPGNKVGTERIYRIKPRLNKQVNGWWICDEGRYSTPMIDQNRVAQPWLPGTWQTIAWDQAMDRLAALFQDLKHGEAGSRCAIIASPHLTNEELLLAHKFFRLDLGIRQIHYGAGLSKKGKADSLLIKEDKCPNLAGAIALAESAHADPVTGARYILEQANQGRIDTLILLDVDLENYFELDLLKPALSKITKKVALMSHTNELYSRIFDLILPLAVYAEKDGTFTNFENRVQRLYQALAPYEGAKTLTEILDTLAQRLGLGWHFADSRDIFETLGKAVPLFSGVRYSQLGPLEKQISPKVVHKGA